MCLPFRDDNPVIVYEAQRAVHNSVALFVLIVLIAVSPHLRPDDGPTPGVPIEVGSVPPAEPTSAPPFPWRTK